MLVGRLCGALALGALAGGLVGRELLGRRVLAIGRGHDLTIYSAAVPAAVSIIGGSGALGFGLAVRLGLAGANVTIGSRDPDRAAATAARAAALVPSATFAGVDNAHAAAANDLVVLCVPFRNQSETLTNIRGSLRPGQLVLDTTVPLAAAVSGRATRMLGVWQGSAAQQAQEMVPAGVRVVAGLHTVSATSLADPDHVLDEDVLLCGDRPEDKLQIADLIGSIPGLRCVDAGKLELARITESLTALLISINARHRVHAGLKVTGLPL